MPTTLCTLRFRKITHFGLSAQAINFAQSSFMGHRVSFNVPVDFMNEYFRWTRAADELRPTGRFVSDPAATYSGSGPTAMPNFLTMLERALGSAYTDMDAVAQGLNYSSPALNSTADMKRDNTIMNYTWSYSATGAGTQSNSPTGTHYSINDLVMAFVLNKCFGSSAYDAWDIVYNLGDAFGMLTDEQLAEAIHETLEEEEDKAAAQVMPTKQVSAQSPGDDKGRVDEMFRSLLAMDPQRFYKNGTQIAGLFETNDDEEGSGNWCLTVGDKIEIPVRLYFRAPVTVLSVVDNAKNPSSATPQQVETVFIKGESSAFDPHTASSNELANAAKNGNVMSLRLQILCSEPVMASGVTRATSEDVAVSLPSSVASFVNPVFYDGANYQTQTAIAVVFTNLGSTTWTIKSSTTAALPTGVTASLTNSVLQLTYNPATGSASVTTVSVELEDSVGSATPPPAQSIKITISNPPA